VPQELIESELFGHEKGAFTGAIERKIGLFEMADGGTLFLDELPSLPLEAQPKLLRALESFTIRRVGGTREIKVDVRLVSATNKDLEEMIEEGTFRDDLYYRLRVIPVDLPPLAERVPDIPYFATLFATAEREGVTPPKGLTARAIKALCDYPWPGNIRQLSNAMERAAILANGAELIDVNHLPHEIVIGDRIVAGDRATAGYGYGSGSGANGATAPGALDDTLPVDLPAEGIDLLAARDRWERRMMLQALARTDGNQKQAADLLHLTRDKWRSRMSKFGIGG
jgi:two-component system nitrogen regulation response regulator GlnG